MKLSYRMFLRSFACLVALTLSCTIFFVHDVCLAEESSKSFDELVKPPVSPSYRLKRMVQESKKLEGSVQKIEMQKLLGRYVGDDQSHLNQKLNLEQTIIPVNDKLPTFSFGPLGPAGPSGPGGPGYNFIRKRELSRPACIGVEGMGEFLYTNQLFFHKTNEGVFLMPGSILVPYRGQMMDRDTGEIFFDKQTLLNFKRNNQSIPPSIRLIRPIKLQYSGWIK